MTNKERIQSVEETVASIKNLIGTVEKFRNSYFWSSKGNAASRRWYEKQNSIPEFSWTESEDSYTAEFTVTCSCRNVYASGYYTKNGEKTTLLAVKNSLKRLEGVKND